MLDCRLGWNARSSNTVFDSLQGPLTDKTEEGVTILVAVLGLTTAIRHIMDGKEHFSITLVNLF
jgi:hypothetical protein